MDVRFSSIRRWLTVAAAGGFVFGYTGSERLVADECALHSDAPEFVHLNYSRMTADEAFEGETLLVAMRVSEDSHGLREPSENASPQERSPESVQTDSQPVAPAKGITPGTSHVTIRSLQSVSLFDATAARSEDGAPLAVPQSVVTPTAHRVEEQFVAYPWHRSHPPRNSFPFRHQPLYFEDPNLERCGDSYGCLTEAISIAHFAGRIPLLPYMMASDNPHTTVPALRDCPSGGSFGPQAYLPRPTVKAVAVQAAAVTGFIFVIP